jgi:hypothetical protein
MKNLKPSYLWAVVLIALLCAACNKVPEETSQTSNPNVKVEKLFTHDGCTVYRFYDGGRDHYFSKCENAKTQTISEQSCGRGCVRDEVISGN